MTKWVPSLIFEIRCSRVTLFLTKVEFLCFPLILSDFICGLYDEYLFLFLVVFIFVFLSLILPSVVIFIWIFVIWQSDHKLNDFLRPELIFKSILAKNDWFKLSTRSLRSILCLLVYALLASYVSQFFLSSLCFLQLESIGDKYWIFLVLLWLRHHFLF